MTALLAVNAPRPLDNFPLLRSADVEEVREALARVYAGPALISTQRTGSLNAVINNCRLRCVELAFAAFGVEIGLIFHFRLRGAALSAAGKRKDHMRNDFHSSGGGLRLPAFFGRSSSDELSADYAQLILRVDARVLAEKLRSMIGAPLKEPLRIDTQKHPTDPPRGRRSTICLF